MGRVKYIFAKMEGGEVNYEKSGWFSGIYLQRRGGKGKKLVMEKRVGSYPLLYGDLKPSPPPINQTKPNQKAHEPVSAYWFGGKKIFFFFFSRRGDRWNHTLLSCHSNEYGE